nr:PhzF family phenazine biosynthesis protein [Octadecabacter algicola]
MQCDVFSTTPKGGNGLAVVLDGDGLDDEAMQGFARWTNLAETTFVRPPSHPDADYDIRIFTAQRELPFAGHPTLGTATCWLEAGNTPKADGVIRQNCGVGIVDIDLTGDQPAFVAPPTAISILPDRIMDSLVDAFGFDATRVLGGAVLDNGPVWHVLELTDANDLLDLDASKISADDSLNGFAVGLIAPHAKGDVAFEVRMFDLKRGAHEDPITGSLNAALAHWLQSQGRVQQPYVVAQGSCIHRTGRVHVIPNDAGEIRIGGHTNILIKGTVTL